ncbi:MAG: VOC family protein [Anaerolineales bacterium]|nr:VOC family protein [Anaerolineales bacterium]
MSKRNIVHVEIPAVNMEGAGKFYHELFGWKIQPMPEMNYTMWEVGDGDEYGGFPLVSDENPAGQVLVYFASDDIEADLKKVEKLGGKVVHPKAEIPARAGMEFFRTRPGMCWLSIQA